MLTTEQQIDHALAATTDFPRDGGYIRTFSGRQFWPLQPDRGEICIYDMAHALSNICRFTGHCRAFYSVAQHSVHVWDLVRSREALLHDGSEAYLCDLASPVKAQCSGYKSAEEGIEQRIAAEFNLIWPWPAEVKHADQVLFETERRDLMPSFIGRAYPVAPLAMPIEPWTPEFAKREFLSVFFGGKRNSPPVWL